MAFFKRKPGLLQQMVDSTAAAAHS